jgi:hypothetical protein
VELPLRRWHLRLDLATRFRSRAYQVAGFGVDVPAGLATGRWALSLRYERHGRPRSCDDGTVVDVRAGR